MHSILSQCYIHAPRPLHRPEWQFPNQSVTCFDVPWWLVLLLGYKCIRTYPSFQSGSEMLRTMKGPWTCHNICPHYGLTSTGDILTACSTSIFDKRVAPTHSRSVCSTTRGVLLGKANRQYLLTLQVRRYCLLALQSRLYSEVSDGYTWRAWNPQETSK